MVYEPGVPAASQRISDSQGPIQENFTVLNNIFDNDHIKYNDASGDPPPPGLRGFHKKSTYVKRDSDPSAFADIGTVFTSDNGDGLIELRYRGDSGAIANGKVLTLSAIKVQAAFNTQTADGFLAVGAIFQRYNIATIEKSSSGGNYFFDIRFSDKLNSSAANTDMEYIVLMGHGTGSDLFNLTDAYVSPTKNDRLLFVARDDNISRLSFAILTV